MGQALARARRPAAILLEIPGFVVRTISVPSSYRKTRGAALQTACETARRPRSCAHVNRTILEDLETKVLALRALHAKWREADEGPSFGDIVARSRPI